MSMTAYVGRRLVLVIPQMLLISIVTFSSVRTGTLKIKVTSSSKSVRIDGLAIRRVP